ncbi:F-box protein At5g62510-like [Rutidosis leptorrhynchoides]|uniref:F-box protein At5g62510-like n=1 Tax=Rutidosis leptorrhynchoides TaxID=125765 RepID=UPI003A9984BE
MSDNIPFEILNEIMKSLPLKSLMRFRSVCKQWNSMIDSSRFVSDYNLLHTQPHLFIVYKEDHREDGLKYVSIVDDDDDNFPEQICDMTAIIPNSIKQMFVPNKRMGPTRVRSAQGLLCFYGCSRAVIWNPWIRKSVEFTVPNVDYLKFGSIAGFGVCPKTSDPKFVKITFFRNSLVVKTWEVEVFSLSLGFWRTRSYSKINNLLCQSLSVMSSSECVDGFIYWVGFNMNDGIWALISFDVTNEEFGVIPLPNSFKRYNQMDVSKHRESLVLLTRDYFIDEYDCDVWIMESGDTKSFKKLFNVNSNDEYAKMMAISYNGEAILERQENCREENVASIETYEPSSKRFKFTSINGIPGFTTMTSYMETMLLHGLQEV